MPSDRADALPTPSDDRADNPAWPRIVVRVPPDWKRWLDEMSTERGLSVAALVRQCIRQLMIARHEA